MKALALAAGLLATGAAQAACPGGLHRVTTAQLYFGLSIPAGGAVSEADWKSFLDTEVTPRFPAGLTAFDAAGQWRRPDGVLSREPTRVLLIILPGEAGEQARLRHVAEAYKLRFHQLSVLITERSECAAF